VGSRPILVAGGGIGGLATALALAQRGYKCRILERNRLFDEAGAGIQLGPNGVAALRALGVGGRLEPHVGVPDELRVWDAKRGSVLATLPLGDTIAQRLGAPYWTAHRADLHAALLAQAQREPAIVIQMGFEADQLEATPDGVQLTSGAGVKATGAALIGADGMWSKVRRYVSDGIDLRFTGRRAYRSVIPTEQAPLAFQANVVGLWLARGAHVVHYPLRGGVEIAVVVILQGAGPNERWSEPAGREGLLSQVAKLTPGLRDFLAVADHWSSWGLYAATPLPRWSNGRVTLVGDAAHPLLPFLAQGGVLALEDALTLAASLAQGHGDIPRAFEAYAKARFARAGRVASTARRNGMLYHLGGPAALARNLVMKALPAPRLIGQYDWLYRWTPPA
jgi:salicylate hydroxylase